MPYSVELRRDNSNAWKAFQGAGRKEFADIRTVEQAYQRAVARSQNNRLWRYRVVEGGRVVVEQRQNGYWPVLPALTKRAGRRFRRSLV